MREAYEYVYSLAELIWGLTTTDRQDDFFLEISNEKGFELLINAFFGGNGINLKFELFHNGLSIADDVLDGGSFEKLTDFLKMHLAPNDVGSIDFQKDNNRVLNYEEFTKTDFSLTGFSGRNISSFYSFLEDQEIEKVLSEIPEIALDR